jgi:hypothetical protein
LKEKGGSRARWGRTKVSSSKAPRKASKIGTIMGIVRIMIWGFLKKAEIEPAY